MQVIPLKIQTLVEVLKRTSSVASNIIILGGAFVEQIQKGNRGTSVEFYHANPNPLIPDPTHLILTPKYLRPINWGEGKAVGNINTTGCSMLWKPEVTDHGPFLSFCTSLSGLI